MKSLVPGSQPHRLSESLRSRKSELVAGQSCASLGGVLSPIPKYPLRVGPKPLKHCQPAKKGCQAVSCGFRKACDWRCRQGPNDVGHHLRLLSVSTFTWLQLFTLTPLSVSRPPQQRTLQWLNRNYQLFNGIWFVPKLLHFAHFADRPSSDAARGTLY